MGQAMRDEIERSAHAGLGVVLAASAFCGCHPSDAPTVSAAAGARANDASTDDTDRTARPLAKVHLLGRFDTRDAAGPRFAWPGSAIAATFQGTGIQVVLTDTGTNDFAVVVDGGRPVKLATSGVARTYTLASNLAQGLHTVVLTKRTESLVGVVQFLGFDVQGGSLVPEPERFTRRIEYVGDSITCGYGNLGEGPNCGFSDDTEDETVAYGALAAGALDAQQTVIAYSGRGVYRDHRGNTSNQMPMLFGLSLADDPTSAWDFRTPPPDVVVVNLSTNDFARGDPGAAFERAYEAFLRQLRARYAMAYVICAASPMLDGTNRMAAIGYIEDAVHAVNAAGDARVWMLQVEGDGGAPADGGAAVGFAAQLASDGYGCDYHPSAKTDAVMAAALESQIRRVTGW